MVSRYQDDVEYLVNRKFPILKLINYSPPLTSSSRGGGMSFERRQEINNEAQVHKETLLAMPRSELAALVKQEQKKEAEEALRRREKEEQECFFNQPDADADLVHWSKAAYWTLDEAVALSFGKAPEHVKWDSVIDFVQDSAFAAQYARVRELTLRAKAVNQLHDPVRPTNFLAWAKRTDISYPAELEERLAARGLQIADWKSLYDELKEKHAKYTAATEADIAELKGEIERLTRGLIESRERQTELEQASQASAANEKPFGTRERDTLLKLLIGMAMKKYRYDPRSPRSETPKRIADHLAGQGLSVTPETVLKKLREAAELLPPEALEDLGE